MNYRMVLSPVLLTGLLFAADSTQGIYGVYNEVARGSPVVAPGSIILIFSGAFSIGPSAPRQASGYPLVTNLAGTSVRVTVGGSTLDAFILATESQWVRAVVPSNTPLGDGRLVVTYDGQSSASYLITVVARAFGLYNGDYTPPGYLSPTFFIPRSVENISLTGVTTLNGPLTPVRPGEFGVLWGTGLGAAPGEEAVGPIPADLKIPGLQVMVANQQARVIYAGRSGCCGGMDEVIFEVPPGIEGCNVPVWVRFADDGSGTDDVLVSIASGEGACSDPGGLSESEVRAVAGGNLTAAQISSWSDTGNSPPKSNWMAWFGAAALSNTIPLGTCTTRPWGTSSSAFDVVSLKDAGPVINITTSDQTLQARWTAGNRYVANFTGLATPGGFTLDNGAGGADIGPLLITGSVPPLSFNVSANIASATLPEGVQIKWNAQGASEGFVAMWGQFGIDGETCGSCGFFCLERADSGSFTVPSPIVQRAFGQRGEPNEIELSVSYSRSERVAAPGFDIAELRTATIAVSKYLDIK